MRISEWSSDVCSSDLRFVGINNERVLADYSGSSLPFSPKWHIVADASYEWDLNDSLGAFVGANMLYNSKTNSTLGVASSSVIGSFKTVDLRAGIKALDERWSVSVWGRNVFNEYYWTNQFVTKDVIVRYAARPARTEEHTTELQSLMRITYQVFCLKKNKTI